MKNRRPAILVGMGAFWPGNDASGPNQSLRNMCTALADEYDFAILSRDRPFGGDVAEAVERDWTDLGFARVRYLTPRHWGLDRMSDVVRATPHDLVILNGFFDRDITLPLLLARRLGRIPRRPIILSPRGEFGQGALSIKNARKRIWISLAHRLSVLSDGTLHATSTNELDDIRAGFPWAGSYTVAGNIARLPNLPAFVAASPKAPLRIAFVGRISPVKNLDVVLSALATTMAPCRLTIVGPTQDKDYWRACQAQIATLPSHLEVVALGEVSVDRIPTLLATQDLFFLPSKSENFGHAIFEALACGVPCLISNTTPWRGLETAKAGWDLPLGDPTHFAKAIDAFAALHPGARARFRAGARALAERRHAASGATDQTREMFEGALGQTDPRFEHEMRPNKESARWNLI